LVFQVLDYTKVSEISFTAILDSLQWQFGERWALAPGSFEAFLQPQGSLDSCALHNCLLSARSGHCSWWQDLLPLPLGSPHITNPAAERGLLLHRRGWVVTYLFYSKSSLRRITSLKGKAKADKIVQERQEFRLEPVSTEMQWAHQIVQTALSHVVLVLSCVSSHRTFCLA